MHCHLRLFSPLFNIQQFLWRDALSTCVNPSRLLESLRDTCSAASVGVGRRVAGCADGICYLQFAQRKMKMVGLQRIHPISYQGCGVEFSKKPFCWMAGWWPIIGRAASIDCSTVQRDYGARGEALLKRRSRKNAFSLCSLRWSTKKTKN